MARRASISLKREVALTAKRVLLGGQKLVYVLVTDRPTKYRWGEVANSLYWDNQEWKFTCCSKRGSSCRRHSSTAWDKTLSCQNNNLQSTPKDKELGQT